MDREKLEAQSRQVLGRKVKNLRQMGFLPAHVFGHQIESLPISVEGKLFNKIYTQVGETGLVDLVIDGAKPRPVLIHALQIDPVSDLPLHVDFYQVNLAEKVNVNIPLEFIGESPAVEQKIGLLLTPISEIEVEALPENLPEKIEVDVSGLINIGDTILIKDLKVPSQVTVLSDSEQVVASIDELIAREVEEELAAEEAAKAATAAEATAAQTGEVTTEAGEEEKPEEKPISQQTKEE